ncbi:dTDP-6-deoxy-3,4-keto-hexulose isomerase [Spirochaetia bacterium]|nr:dTDP-6-deoxy-3,4-keto-hexulose isomerase [Spirochaetia bacterium]
MQRIIKLKTHTDSRGSLTVLEKVLPFEIKRIYYIYNCSDQERGGHRHKKTIQALICIKGSCIIDWKNSSDGGEGAVLLNEPDTVLLLLPEDYHTMHSFSKDAVLLVLASEYFDADDYIEEAV